MFTPVSLTKSGTLYVIIIIVLVIAGAMVLTGGVFPTNYTTVPGEHQVQVDPNTVIVGGEKGQKNLQLFMFMGQTPTPAPPPVIGTSNPQTGNPVQTPTNLNGWCPLNVEASFEQCMQDNPANGPVVCQHPACKVAKPVIYLYPPRSMAVHVELQIPGIITTSIPQYPSNGWDVVAHPGGALSYQGKTYNELFYESEVDKINPPTRGIVIPHSQLREKLLSFTHQLGLLSHEQQEFLAYWLPKLRALKSPYIQFSLISKGEKKRIDHVIVLPTPQTSIEFLVYFKPLQTNVITLKALELPKTPPKRIGFTEVEWGGTIGN